MERYLFAPQWAAVSVADYFTEMGEMTGQGITNSQRDWAEEGLICPIPRRIPSSSSLYSHISSLTDREAGSELMDILLCKGTLAGDQCNSVGSFPCFCGSPPSRASNPLIHDVQFTMKRNTPPLIHLPKPSYGSKPLSPCSSYGANPSVRIEGFSAASCPDSNRGILTLA